MSRMVFGLDEASLLAEIDQSVDPSLGVHLVMGNGSSHTSKETRRWLEVHPRLVAGYNETARHLLGPTQASR